MTQPTGRRAPARRPKKNGQQHEPVVTVSSIEGLASATRTRRRPVEFWLPGALAPGSITLLEARSGDGKSTIAAALAAAISGGPAPPDWTGPRDRSVLWCAGEESWEAEVLTRLIDAGVPLHRLYRPDMLDGHGQPRRLILPGDLPALEQAMLRGRVGLLVCDPISSTCDLSLDLRQEQQARAYIEPLQQMLGRLDAACIGMRHLRKSRGGDPRDAGLGGVALTNTCRIVLRCDQSPHERGLYLLSAVVTNLGGRASTRTYRMPVSAGGLVTIQWVGTSPLSARDIVELLGSDDDADEWSDAERLVAGIVGDGRVRSTVVLAEAQRAAVSLRTLRRAKKALGVVSDRVQVGAEGHWDWLPPPDGWPVSLRRSASPSVAAARE